MAKDERTPNCFTIAGRGVQGQAIGQGVSRRRAGSGMFGSMARVVEGWNGTMHERQGGASEHKVRSGKCAKQRLNTGAAAKVHMCTCSTIERFAERGMGVAEGLCSRVHVQPADPKTGSRSAAAGVAVAAGAAVVAAAAIK